MQTAMIVYSVQDNVTFIKAFIKSVIFVHAIVFYISLLYACGSLIIRDPLGYKKDLSNLRRDPLRSQRKPMFSP